MVVCKLSVFIHCLVSFSQAKLSTVNKATCLIWVGGGVLASCSGEAVVRFWDFEGGDNYSLGLGSGATPEEVVTCISYNSE